MRRKLIRVAKIVLSIVVIGAVATIMFFNHPKFGREVKEGSERAKRMAASPNYRDGAFHNLEPIPPAPPTTEKENRWVTLYKMFINPSEATRPRGGVASVKVDIKSITRNNDLLLWLGHATYFLQYDGVRIVTDPVLVNSSPVSFINKPFKGTDIYTPDDLPELDYVIITHDHWDHLDYHTIKEIKGRTNKFIVPLGIGEHLEYWGVESDKIVELDWYQDAVLQNNFKITSLPSRHYSGRKFKKDGTLWCGYMLQIDNINLYLSGDGGYGSHIADIASRFPQIDWAILENGQYDNQWRYIHFVPEDLLTVIEELKPQRFVTSHNSKYAMARHDWDNPLKTIYDASKLKNYNYFYPQIGETVNLRDTVWSGEKWW